MIKPEKITTNGVTKYFYSNVPFDTEAAAQEYIDKKILKVHLLDVSISSEIENMCDEERKVTLDKMAKESDLLVSDCLQTKR